MTTVRAEAMPRVPPGEAQRRGEERGFIGRECADRVEGGAGIRVRLHGGGHPRLSILKPEEDFRKAGDLPLQAAVGADGGQAIAPNQLPCAIGEELGKPLGVHAHLIGTIDPGAREERFRPQAFAPKT